MSGKLQDKRPAKGSGDYEVRTSRVVEPGFSGVYVEVLDEAGTLLGSPVRLFDPANSDGRVKGDTPGVNGAHFHQNGAGQVDLAGR